MFNYIARRLLLIIPTLFGIMLINFIIVQAAPGGPVEKTLAQLQGLDSDLQSRMGGSAAEAMNATSNSSESSYRGAQGLDPELVKQIENIRCSRESSLNRGVDLR